MASRTALTEAQWNELHTVVQDPADRLRSWYAQEIFKRTDNFRKALRADECGSRMRMRTSKGCCTCDKYRHCRTQFCEFCVQRLRLEALNRWRDTMTDPTVVAGAKQFTLVTLYQPIIAADEPELKKALKKFFKSLGAPDKSFKLMRRYDFERGCVEVRILYLNNDISLGQWLARFPQASVQVWFFDIDRVHEVFKDKLLEPYIPTDGRKRAEQEVLFTRIQRFSAVGLKMIKKPKIALFTETELSVNNEDPAGNPGLDCGLGKCKHGHYYDQKTRWYPAHEPMPPDSCLEWERVPPLPIQPTKH